MSTLGQKPQYALKSVKSHLSSAFTTIEYLMLDYGYLRIKPDEDHPMPAPELGVHLYQLCLEMERLRNHVDSITDWTRESLGLKKLKPREGANLYATDQAKHFVTMWMETRGMSDEEMTAYLEKYAAEVGSKGMET